MTLNDTKTEQDKLFDGKFRPIYHDGSIDSDLDWRALMSAIENRDLAIENATRAEVIEEVISNSNLIAAGKKDGSHGDAFFILKKDLLALLTTSPSQS